LAYLLTRPIEFEVTVSAWVAATLAVMICRCAVAARPARWARSTRSATALVRAASASSISFCAAASLALAAL
jgi:hypothetical protein